MSILFYPIQHSNLKQRHKQSIFLVNRLWKTACIFLIILTVCTGPAYAQSSTPERGKPSTGTISGKVVDEKLKEPLPYVPVRIMDSASKIVLAVLTDQEGNFKADSLPPGSYVIEITYVGYQAHTQKVSVTETMVGLDLGLILMKEDASNLNEVVVTAERSELSLKADKKVFLMGKDILSQSGSVSDILNGIPSVTIDPGGAVRLRGNSNVTVLINGRRSGLTLGNVLTQIPAGNIEKVEIMTSPSAHYDAAGSAGIINIVLKKNTKEGLNGQARLVLGTPNDYNLNTSLNYKTNKLNLFATLGGRYTDYVGFYTTKQATTGGTGTSLSKVQNENRHDDGRLVYLGADYSINPRNTFTVAFFKNATKDIDGTVLKYDFGNAGMDSATVRNGSSREVRSYNQLESNYTRNFDKEGKKFTVDLQYDFWNSDKTWNLSTQKTFPLTIDRNPIRTISIGSSKDLVLQSDWINPFKDKSDLALGFKVENRSVSSNFKAEEQLNYDWVIFDKINNNLDYNERIGSMYVQYKSKPKAFNYLLGLRFETTRIKIQDKESIFNTQKNYSRLFPTVNLSYVLGKETTVQMNYVKRINRPALWYLYPFNELTDFNSQFIGNPDLNPSYTHAIELVLLKQWEKLTFNPSIYSHFMTAPIEFYAYQNDKDVFITMPFNLERETRYGFDLSVTYDPIKWLYLNGQFNIYEFRQTGNYRATDFGFSNTSWNSRINLRVKLPGKFTFQGRYNFEGPDNNAQSQTKSFYSVDLGLSKNLIKDKATLTLDGANVFNSRKIRSLTTSENYVIDQTANFNAARYRLSFTYRFTKKESQTFRIQKEGNRQ
jgi:hypothetical protein